MTSPYRTDGNIILEYKSNRKFLLKNKLLLRRLSLLTKLEWGLLCSVVGQISECLITVIYKGTFVLTV